MLNAAKNNSLSLAGLMALRVLLLLVVALCLGQTRVLGFAVTPQPASGVFESVTPSSTGENYDGCPYDASDSLLAAKGVGTAADDAAFWSGRAGVNRSAAEASGLTTLERTSAGRALDAQDLFSKLPYDEAIVPWENLSRQFASEASGTVRAWTGGASPTSVWSKIEKPTLMLNPNVNKIIIQDATQPWKTKIIYK